MQDPNPTPWGTQDRFQAHYIVRKNNITNVLDYTTRTTLSTTGHFGSKKVTEIYLVLHMEKDLDLAYLSLLQNLNYINILVFNF